MPKRGARDDWFWSQAPRLEGDFPQHWKHSWVYDFETLRMMVRRQLAEGGALRISLRAHHPHLPRRDLVGGAFVCALVFRVSPANNPFDVENNRVK